MSLLKIEVSIPEANDGSEPAINTRTGEPYLFGVALARAIRDRLLDEGLSQNGHIHGAYETSYNWEGENYTRQERTLSLKVDASDKDQIIEIINDMHPYKTVSIAATPFEALTRDYQDWVAGEGEQCLPER